MKEPRTALNSTSKVRKESWIASSSLQVSNTIVGLGWIEFARVERNGSPAILVALKKTRAKCKLTCVNPTSGGQGAIIEGHTRGLVTQELLEFFKVDLTLGSPSSRVPSLFGGECREWSGELGEERNELAEPIGKSKEGSTLTTTSGGRKVTKSFELVVERSHGTIGADSLSKESDLGGE